MSQNSSLVSNTCAWLFSQNSYRTLQTNYSFVYQVILGYNRFNFTQPIMILKGSMLLLIQGTGRIAIDTSGSSVYSDLAWQTNGWSNLNTYSNWRFYIDTLNDMNIYQNSFTLSHVYSSAGTYRLKISCSISSFYYDVAVNNCKKF